MDNSFLSQYSSPVTDLQPFTESEPPQAYRKPFSKRENEKTSSGMLVLSFIVYLLGAMVIDYGWYHHAIGAFFLGLVIVFEALCLLFVSFIQLKTKRLGFSSLEEPSSSEALINDLPFISMKM